MGDLEETLVGHGNGMEFTWSPLSCSAGGLAAASSQLVYVACSQDLARYDGVDWEVTPGADLGIGSTTRYVLLFDVLATSADNVWLSGCDYPDETYWLGASCFVANWDGSQWHRFEPGASLGTMALDSGSGLWAAQTDAPRIARFDGSAWLFDEF